MAFVNRVIEIGRLTSDPELRRTGNGTAVCSFNIAVMRPIVKDKTDFLPCVSWRGTAEYLTKYGKKGALVSVDGILTSRSYEDKGGHKRTAIEIVADNVQLLERRSPDTTAAYAPDDPETLEPVESDAEGDLPF